MRKYELVQVPAGTFLMGASGSEKGRADDEEKHEVTLSAFAIGRFTVTNAQYGLFLEANPGAGEPEYWADRKFNQPNQPVVGVSWDDAEAYCAWAGLRLPSEAEWEYACRAGTTTRYWSGDTEDDLARVGWYDENSDDRLHPVGERDANAFGLFDAHGNVWEWCADWYGEYKRKAVTNPTGARRGGNRVLRGGSWLSTAGGSRSAIRGGGDPGNRGISIGFRPARSITP